MVLIFAPRSAQRAVVVVNIPLRYAASWPVIGGHTINLMTLGACLAVGILWTKTTVEIENIHVNFTSTPLWHGRSARGTEVTAVRAVAGHVVASCGFVPSFFMRAGAPASCFVPLSLAVGSR